VKANARPRCSFSSLEHCVKRVFITFSS